MELESNVEHGLIYLGEFLSKKLAIDNPTENNGSVFENETFTFRAFYWGDEDEISDLPNFKYKDFEVVWYKHLGRSSTQNRKVSVEEFNDILLKCINSVS